jgi:hypothetical protein
MGTLETDVGNICPSMAAQEFVLDVCFLFPSSWIQWLTPTSEKYALTEASYPTIRMVQHLESIETRDPNPWTERIDLVTSSHHGCKVRVKWR